MARTIRAAHSLAALLTGAALLAGCGSGGTTQTGAGASTLPPTGASTTSAPAPATTPVSGAPATTTGGGSGASTTSSGEGTTTTAANASTTAAPRSGADSGTTDGDKVPDGTYWGYLTEATKVGNQQAVKWDEARFLMGPEADAEAKRQGKPPPDNNYIIINSNPGLKTTRVAADARITKLRTDPAKPVPSPLSGVVGSKTTLYILTIKKVDGVSVITEIKQQYRP